MNKHVSIVVPDQLYHEVRNHLLENPEEEAAAFLLAGVHRASSCTRLLARRMVYIPRHLYRQKLDYHLDIAPQAINGIASLCEATGLTAVICHSHPGKGHGLAYSPSDDFGEQRISSFLRQLTDNKPVGSLLFSQSAVRGRAWLSHVPIPINSIITVGEVLQHRGNTSDTGHPSGPQRYSRQVLLLGDEGQRILSTLRIGIVGVGGTGSCVAEQLARLGVASFVLIDDDDLEESNLTRMYGAFPDQFRRGRFSWRRKRDVAKVKIVAEHLLRINPDLSVQAIKGNAVVTDVARRLLDCDAICLCTDEHWGRSVVNQISYQYLIPVVNMGVRVDASGNAIRAAAADVHTLGPGKPCLWCYQFLSSERISAESMLPEQRAERLREGYVEGIGPAPMVISLTSAVASIAVTELLHLFTSFREERGLKRLKWDIMEGRFWQGGVQPPEQCVCRDMLGYGDLKPLSTHEDAEFVQKCRSRT